MAPTPPRGPGPLLLALGLLAAGLAVVRVRLEPPPPLPADAPAARFSAGRALERLATLVGDDIPHPVGSPAADRMRARLLAEFAALGVPFIRERAGTRANYWLNAIFLPSRAERDRFLELSNGQGVMARPAWVLMHKIPPYAAAFRDPLPNAEALQDRLINIPSGVTAR